MGGNIFPFIRGILILAMVTALFFTGELLLEGDLGGFSLSRMFSFDQEQANRLLGTLNVKLNQAMAVAFIAVGIAVPLTANMYSVKFLDFFIKNSVNAVVLTFVVLSNLTGAWAGYVIKNSAVPAFHLNFVFFLTIACLLLLFPYLTYVFRFLHPNTLLTLLERDVKSNLQAARQAEKAKEVREPVAETLEHIANIAIRSIDRADRNTAIAGVLALERIARYYWKHKGKIHPTWFQAEPNFFLGFSPQAIEEMTGSCSWLEMKLYYQMLEILRAACPRVPELTSTIARSLRQLGLEPSSLQDHALRELPMEYFNTFLRLAINRRDVRSVFIIFDQYRRFAEALNGSFSDQVLEIAYYFEYYGQAARDQQMSFVVETVAYDLAHLVQQAWETKAPNREELLERFLRYDGDGKKVFPGVKKAQALLASYFLLAGRPEPVELIRASFEGLDPALLKTIKEELLRVTRQKYWEISERRMNIDFVPDPQREKLREFFESLEGKDGK